MYLLQIRFSLVNDICIPVYRYEYMHCMIIPFKVEICFHYTSNLVLSHSTLSLLSSKLVTITVQKFLVMSESIEEILDHESTHRQGEPQPSKPDLVDYFQLFKSYLDFKLVDLKQDLISEQDNFTQKV